MQAIPSRENYTAPKEWTVQQQHSNQKLPESFTKEDCCPANNCELNFHQRNSQVKSEENLGALCDSLGSSEVHQHSSDWGRAGRASWRGRRYE
jgi:hypothetical protein